MLDQEILLTMASSTDSRKAEIETLYQEAKENRELFFQKQAEQLDWFTPFTKVLEWNSPYAKWFIGGELNASFNCLDRHLQTDVRTKKAIIWEGENGETREYTYEELHQEVCKFANGLKELGIKKGDKVAIYLPLIPEAVISMLACARIGAVHTVVFGGFSAEALRDRILDAEAKLLITADGGYRRGKIIPLKETADLAIQECNSVQQVIVVQRTNEKISFKEKDIWYHKLIEKAGIECLPEKMQSEDELFILYTSGTTGKPKGIVHTTAGYLVGVNFTTRVVFGIEENDIFWCTADVGWITGHSYVVYGPLSNGMTQFLFEGVPDYPMKNQFWKLIEKHRVTILYTAPTVIRSFMKWGEEWVTNCDLSSLRLLGSVGEPINPQAWLWYYEVIGQKRCPVIDTWWQTETGSIMIAPIAGYSAMKPGSATQPIPGIDVQIIDEEGEPAHAGFLTISSPWPSMLRGIHKDNKRYEETYWKQLAPTAFFTGDGVSVDEEGFYWLAGRVDDVMNISGHRLGTMEVESAIVSYPAVAEAAVIGIADPIKGQAIAAFITLKEGVEFSSLIDIEIKKHVTKKIGAIAKPDKIIFICELPKTRSGKIMRRLLRDIAEGKTVGDTSSLADVGVLETIKKQYVD
jgi:acetyl-CoA synthetase